MVRPLMVAALWLTTCLAWSLPGFDFEGKDALTGWGFKGNVTLQVAPDGMRSAGAARLEIDPGIHRFAWIRRDLPPADYEGARGIEVAYRAGYGVAGTVEVRLVRMWPEGGRTVYAEQLGDLTDSASQWCLGYTDLRAMKHLLGPPVKPVPGTLGPDWTLLVAVSVSGPAHEEIVVDVDVIRFLGGEQARMAAVAARQAQRERLLLPDDALADDHPRIVFRPERQAALRADGEEGGERATAKRAFLVTMRRIAAGYDPENPLRNTLAVRDNPKLTGDTKRLQFGSALRREAATIEYLAGACQLTGDPEFAALGAEALVNAAGTVTADEPLLIDGGRRMLKSFYPRSLALAYDWLYRALAVDQRRTVRRELVAHITLIDAEARTAGWGRRPLNRVWNFAPGIMSAMGLCVLAVERETRLGEQMLLFDARRYLRDYLILGIDQDGCGHEGPTYLAYGLDSACYFMTGLRDTGRGDLLTETNLQLTAPWLVAETLPGGGRWNNLSDCTHQQGRPAILMYLCGRLAKLAADEPAVTGRFAPATLTASLGHLVQFGETPGERRLSYGALAGLMGWVWAEGPGRNPTGAADPGSQLDQILFYQPCVGLPNPGEVMADGQLFRGRGLAVSRTGYDGEELHLAIEAGPHATGHDQSDKGTFTLRAYGTDLAIDSGYGNDGDPLAGGSSHGHNVVLVDGEGQPLAHHNQSDGWITGYHHGPLADWVRTDALPAWTFRRGRDGEPLRTGTMERANRTFLMVRPAPGTPPYLVVYDDIIKDDQPHDYTWQWHIPASQRFEPDAAPCRTRPWTMTTEALTTSRGSARGSARATLRVKTPGRYLLYGLARAAGAEAGKSDSFFVTLDDGDRLTWDLGGSREWAWRPVQDRSDDGPRVLDLQVGDHHILLETREFDAQWARWLLLPAGASPPSAPDGEPVGAISAGVPDLAPGIPPLQRTTVTTGDAAKGWLELFPVHPADGAVTTDWFRTSTEGSHPRLNWTVRAVRPRLLAVLVPRHSGIPRPVVTPVVTPAAVGVDVRWGETKDRILFASGSATLGDVSMNGSAALLRTRGTELVDWALYDGQALHHRDRTLVKHRPENGVSTSRHKRRASR